MDNIQVNEINWTHELEATSASLQQRCRSKGVSGKQKTIYHVKCLFNLLNYIAEESTEMNWT